MEQRSDDQLTVARRPAPEPPAGAGPFSAREAAGLLGVHDRTIRRAIRDGRLTATRQGRAYVVSAEALGRYWETLRPRPPLRGAARPVLKLVPRPNEREDERQGTTSRFGRGAAGSIPRQLTSFVGRISDVAALSRLVGGGTRLITLIGPGGVGKTRLAIATALALEPQFADGAVFVSLAAVGDAALVLSAVARALDVREVQGRPLLEVLVDTLRERHVLLVLDNFEHVRAAGVDVVRMLEACPRLVAVVTSREPLRVRGEQRFSTIPLALPDGNQPLAPDQAAAFDAIRLFAERASLVDRGFALKEENVSSVVAVCRRLDGLPLAIELAAAWVRVLPPESLLGQLEQRLPLLRGGGEDQPIRLRTMTDAIAWSADRLSGEEARLFRRLGIFVGGFTLDAAQVVTGEVFDVLAALVDKSLIHRTQGPDREPRFTMLETVREYARERLIASGEDQAVAAAHAAYVRNLAEVAEPDLLGPEEQLWQARIDAELGNVRAALTWALDHEVETALRIAAPLWVYWSIDHLAEGRRWLSAALARSSSAPDVVRARAMTAEAALACLLGDVTASEAMAVAAAAELHRAGDQVWAGRAHWIAGASPWSESRLADAARELDRALALLAHATTPSGRAHEAYAGWTRGAHSCMAGEVDEGIDFLESALKVARASGSAAVSTLILGDLAGWMVSLGSAARARSLLHEALPLIEDYFSMPPALVTLTSLALVAAVEGDAEAAAQTLGAIQGIRTRTGHVIPSHLQARLDHAATPAMSALGEAAFAAKWAVGATNPDGVIAAAIASAGESVSEDKAGRSRLTPREVEVLRLVVAGQADKEIAATLAISRATASRHVGSIRAKLGAPSRSAVAAIAVRNDLA